MAMISHAVYTYIVSDFGNVEALSLTVWYVHHVIYIMTRWIHCETHRSIWVTAPFLSFMAVIDCAPH